MVGGIRSALLGDGLSGKPRPGIQRPVVRFTRAERRDNPLTLPSDILQRASVRIWIEPLPPPRPVGGYWRFDRSIAGVAAVLGLMLIGYVLL